MNKFLILYLRSETEHPKLVELKTKLIKFFAAAAFLLTISHNVNAQEKYANITHYQVFYGHTSRYLQDWMIIRRFENEGKEYYLLVNPRTLETRIDQPPAYQVKPMTPAEANDLFRNTPYVRALRDAESRSRSLQDAGIRKGPLTEAGITLTADLCPSHRPLDRLLFTRVIEAFDKTKQPEPVALSVSGLWMKAHAADLEWLKKLQADNRLNITWINHSYSHRYSAKAPLKKNFLLEPGTNIEYEVLQTEKIMLENGLLPSVFFRFPGLVSDQQLFDRITAFGLVPIGTDAWLAKGQKAQAGSIVLIHANGNEPVGVNDFLKLVKLNAKKISRKQWLIYDLKKTVSSKFRFNDRVREG